MSVRALIRDQPVRNVALATNDHVLIFRHNGHTSHSVYGGNGSSSSSSISETFSQSNTRDVSSRCMVEFDRRDAVDLTNYKNVGNTLGTLGLITLANDVYLCAITGASQVAIVRPGEIVYKIYSVEFCWQSPISYSHEGIVLILSVQIVSIETIMTIFMVSRVTLPTPVRHRGRAAMSQLPVWIRIILLLNILSLPCRNCSVRGTSTTAAILISRAGYSRGNDRSCSQCHLSKSPTKQLRTA